MKVERNAQTLEAFEDRPEELVVEVPALAVTVDERPDNTGQPDRRSSSSAAAAGSAVGRVAKPANRAGLRRIASARKSLVSRAIATASAAGDCSSPGEVSDSTCTSTPASSISVIRPCETSRSRSTRLRPPPSPKRGWDCHELKRSIKDRPGPSRNSLITESRSVSRETVVTRLLGYRHRRCLVDAGSDKQHAVLTYKHGFGFDPFLAYLDLTREESSRLVDRAGSGPTGGDTESSRSADRGGQCDRTRCLNLTAPAPPGGPRPPSTASRSNTAALAESTSTEQVRAVPQEHHTNRPAPTRTPHRRGIPLTDAPPPPPHQIRGAGRRRIGHRGAHPPGPHRPAPPVDPHDPLHRATRHRDALALQVRSHLQAALQIFRLPYSDSGGRLPRSSGS
jgi:hypothetical protein